MSAAAGFQVFSAIYCSYIIHNRPSNHGEQNLLMRQLACCLNYGKLGDCEYNQEECQGYFVW